MSDLLILRKRVIQLEVQNSKFRTLLKSAVDLIENKDKVAGNDVQGSQILNQTIERLEREKAFLENELHNVLEVEGQSPELVERIKTLENENLDLRSQLSDVLVKTKLIAGNIKEVSSKNVELKSTLDNLESERQKFVDELTRLHQMSENLPDQQFSQESLKLHLKILDLDERKSKVQRDMQKLASSDVTKKESFSHKSDQSSEDLQFPTPIQPPTLPSNASSELPTFNYFTNSSPITGTVPAANSIFLNQPPPAAITTEIRSSADTLSQHAESIAPTPKPDNIQVLTTETYVLEDDGNVYPPAPLLPLAPNPVSDQTSAPVQESNPTPTPPPTIGYLADAGPQLGVPTLIIENDISSVYNSEPQQIPSPIFNNFSFSPPPSVRANPINSAVPSVEENVIFNSSNFAAKSESEAKLEQKIAQFEDKLRDNITNLNRSDSTEGAAKADEPAQGEEQEGGENKESGYASYLNPMKLPIIRNLGAITRRSQSDENSPTSNEDNINGTS